MNPMHAIDTTLSLQPHHDGSAVYVKDSEHLQLGESLKLRIRIPAVSATDGSHCTPVGVWLRSLRDGEPHLEPATLDPHQIVDAIEGECFFAVELLLVNPVQRYRWYIQYQDHTGQDHFRWLNAAGFARRDVPDAFDFRIHQGPVSSPWVKDSIMYQIFPDRFANSGAPKPHAHWMVACDWETPVQGSGEQTSRQFYGGDLPGIQKHLEHLARLGATVLYLTPIFPAASNHRYDASSFDEVDPLLGGDAALISLVRAAHALGLRVVGDLTTNHTGDGHHWFVDAYKNPASSTGEYYYFNKDHTEYEAWLGVPSLPKLNWKSAALRERFILAEDSVAVRWLLPPYNLDGWRVDVGNMTGRLGAEDLNQEIAQMLRRRLEQVKPGAMLLAESTSDAAPDVPGDGWQGVVSYSNFTRPLWQWLAGNQSPVNGWFFGLPQSGPAPLEAEDFVATHREFSAGFSWDVRLANVNALDTHDTARAASHMIAGGQEIAACLQFSFPGIPLIFAGDEFGLHGYNGEDSRTPMPWDRPEVWGTDLRELYTQLSAQRTEHRALVDGSLRFIYAHGDLLVYLREHEQGNVLCIFARAALEKIGISFAGGVLGEPFLSHGKSMLVDQNSNGELVISAQGPAVRVFSVGQAPSWR